MNYTRRWIAVDQPSKLMRLADDTIVAELTPEDIGFLAEAINEAIEAWGDPEDDLHTLRRKLRGEERQP